MAERRGLDEHDYEDVEERRSIRAPVLYEINRQRGIDELARPAQSLWWSGVASGLAISASVYCEGFLHLHLPDAAWRPLVENLGYTVGFIVVILGGFQLFTEQTVTAILPLLSDRTKHNAYRTLRLWAIVLLANATGAFAAAAFGTLNPGTSPEQLAAFIAISEKFAANGFIELLFLGIPAGFFIAALAWMLPNSEGGKFWVIMLITYVIALGGFAHVVAGMVEVFILVVTGNLPFLSGLGGIIFPTLIGNIIGGSALFAMIAYGQVSEEI
jgi:formate/nitrite transporter FocA (FNT family)